MTSVFLLYEGQVLPVRCAANARARGLRLTCAPGGELTLTYPPGTADAFLTRFLEINREAIGRRVMEARRRAEALPALEETTFRWLGKTLPVEVKESTRSQARLTGEQVSLALVKGEWPHKALERLRQRLAAPYLAALARARAEELGLTAITVAVRPMLSRYGSCVPATRRICLNSYLTRMPPEVILSVVDHELTHLAHSDHGPAFYRDLLALCPRYREHQARLKAELDPYLTAVRLERQAHKPHPALTDLSSPII